MLRRIYLDNNATTPLTDKVLQDMHMLLKNTWGNASSVYHEGQHARGILTDARNIIARYLNVTHQEIVFGASATTLLNIILRGSIKHGMHVISSNVEHPCIYETLLDLQKQGVDVTFINVEAYGSVKPEQIESAIKPSTKFLVLVAANNETGVLTDIEGCKQIAQRYNLHYIVDGVQLVGKAKMPSLEGISAFVGSSHKFHGPKGAAFAYIRRGFQIHPILTGGEQERKLYPGTENIAAIHAMATALQEFQLKEETYIEHMMLLRNRFEHQLFQIPGVELNGRDDRLANTINVAFEGILGEELLRLLDQKGVSASHGSACSTGSLEPSRILLQMGYSRTRVLSSIRFSLSRMTTIEEVDSAIKIIQESVELLRKY